MVSLSTRGKRAAPTIRKEGFLFQEWLVYQGLAQFVGMLRDWYPDLVKVFYANMRDENGIIYSRDCLRNPDEPKDFTLFKARGMKRDERLCAFVIAWILLPRSGNHAQLTTEDVYLIHALKGRIQTDWTVAVSAHMIKVSKQRIDSLPYTVFLSKVMRNHFIDLTNEVTISCNKKNLIGKLALHQMGLRKKENGWSFKDEHMSVVDEVEPLKVDKSESKYTFKPKTKFEKYMVNQMKLHSAKLSKIEKYLTRVHKKLDYGFDNDNIFGNTSKEEEIDEDDQAKEEFIDIPD
ncbi:hypothetical protein LR48_Vigan07g217200 [Vigna angularis]|uniref:Uncharacterized protein n=1 Tax=Phaseolus angularis TaxID=3914 RepID=A0A0L9V0D1_PHAAN|nr:hypothetical protein LR48_Vigan07g217200 [Vigna angularis]